MISMYFYTIVKSVSFTFNHLLDECLNFLKKQSEDLQLEYKVYEIVPRKPIVVLTWVGQSPSLPAILLNSHMDVVPVFEVSFNNLYI